MRENHYNGIGALTFRQEQGKLHNPDSEGTQGIIGTVKKIEKPEKNGSEKKVDKSGLYVDNNYNKGRK